MSVFVGRGSTSSVCELMLCRVGQHEPLLHVTTPGFSCSAVGACIVVVVALLVLVASGCFQPECRQTRPDARAGAHLPRRMGKTSMHARATSYWRVVPPRSIALQWAFVGPCVAAANWIASIIAGPAASSHGSAANGPCQRYEEAAAAAAACAAAAAAASLAARERVAAAVESLEALTLTAVADSGCGLIVARPPAPDTAAVRVRQLCRELRFLVRACGHASHFRPLMPALLEAVAAALRRFSSEESSESDSETKQTEESDAVPAAGGSAPRVYSRLKHGPLSSESRLAVRALCNLLMFLTRESDFKFARDAGLDALTVFCSGVDKALADALHQCADSSSLPPVLLSTMSCLSTVPGSWGYLKTRPFCSMIDALRVTLTPDRVGRSQGCADAASTLIRSGLLRAPSDACAAFHACGVAEALLAALSSAHAPEAAVIRLLALLESICCCPEGRALLRRCNLQFTNSLRAALEHRRDSASITTAVCHTLTRCAASASPLSLAGHWPAQWGSKDDAGGLVAAVAAALCCQLGHDRCATDAALDAAVALLAHPQCRVRLGHRPLAPDSDVRAASPTSGQVLGRCDSESESSFSLESEPAKRHPERPRSSAPCEGELAPTAGWPQQASIVASAIEALRASTPDARLLMPPTLMAGKLADDWRRPSSSCKVSICDCETAIKACAVIASVCINAGAATIGTSTGTGSSGSRSCSACRPTLCVSNPAASNTGKLLSACQHRDGGKTLHASFQWAFRATDAVGNAALPSHHDERRIAGVGELASQALLRLASGSPDSSAALTCVREGAVPALTSAIARFMKMAQKCSSGREKHVWALRAATAAFIVLSKLLPQAEAALTGRLTPGPSPLDDLPAVAVLATATGVDSTREIVVAMERAGVVKVTLAALQPLRRLSCNSHHLAIAACAFVQQLAQCGSDVQTMLAAHGIPAALTQAMQQVWPTDADSEAAVRAAACSALAQLVAGHAPNRLLLGQSPHCAVKSAVQLLQYYWQSEIGIDSDVAATPAEGGGAGAAVSSKPRTSWPVAAGAVSSHAGSGSVSGSALRLSRQPTVILTQASSPASAHARQSVAAAACAALYELTEGCAVNRQRLVVGEKPEEASRASSCTGGAVEPASACSADTTGRAADPTVLMAVLRQQVAMLPHGHSVATARHAAKLLDILMGSEPWDRDYSDSDPAGHREPLRHGAANASGQRVPAAADIYAGSERASVGASIAAVYSVAAATEEFIAARLSNDGLSSGLQLPSLSHGRAPGRRRRGAVAVPLLPCRRDAMCARRTRSKSKRRCGASCALALLQAQAGATPASTSKSTPTRSSSHRGPRHRQCCRPARFVSQLPTVQEEAPWEVDAVAAADELETSVAEAHAHVLGSEDAAASDLTSTPRASEAASASTQPEGEHDRHADAVAATVTAAAGAELEATRGCSCLTSTDGDSATRACSGLTSTLSC